MSGGREKLNNFSKLKSIVGSGIKEKAARFKKARADRINQDAKSNGVIEESPQTAPSRSNNKQSSRKIMPQYGQNNLQIDDAGDQQESEVVITIDVKKQNEIEEGKLFNWLCRTFPNCINPRSKKPLKIGINDDIQLEYKNVYGSDVDQFILSRVIKRYVGDQKYQQAVIEHAQRYDLQGNVNAAFSEEHLSHAKERLEELKFKANLRAQGIDVRQYYEDKAKKEMQDREAKRLEEDLALIKVKKEASDTEIHSADVNLENTPDKNVSSSDITNDNEGEGKTGE
ncbi:MAG: ProP effector [Francisellaceae bacterium]|jgi:ProP effector